LLIFAIEIIRFTVELQQIEIDASSSTSTVALAKTAIAITHLLTHLAAFSGRRFMSRNEKAWKFKRALLRNEKPL